LFLQTVHVVKMPVELESVAYWLCCWLVETAQRCINYNDDVRIKNNPKWESQDELRKYQRECSQEDLTEPWHKNEKDLQNNVTHS